MAETFYAILAISLLLVVVSVLVPVAERFRLPHTVLLAIAGVGMGFVASWLMTSHLKLGALGDAFVGLDRLKVAADAFLPLFLPPLLFTAGLNIEVRRLMDEIHAVLLLAIVAVVVCIACVGGVVHYVRASTSSSACCSVRSCRPPILPRSSASSAMSARPSGCRSWPRANRC